jgi:hypothetical protein
MEKRLKTTAKPQKTTAKPQKTTAKPQKTKAKPQKTKAKPQKTKAKPEKTKAKPQKGGNLLTDSLMEHTIPSAIKFYTSPVSTSIYSMFAVKKAYDYNKEYSVMSVDIGNEKEAIQVAFDPKVHGEWSGSPGLQMLYLKEYILKKFNNACSIPQNIMQIMIFMLPSNNSVNLIYLNDSLQRQLPNDPKVFFKTIIDGCNKRFVIIPLLLAMENVPIGHANMLIIDKIDGTVEHFEPYGSSPGNILSFFTHKDRKLSVYKYLKEIFNDIGYAYLSPSQTCPLIGPQMVEEFMCHELMIPQIKNKIGMCLLWSLFYIHLRLSNPDLEPIELINNSVKSMGTDLCKFIKGYAQTILEMSKKYDLVRDQINGLVVDYKPK